MASRHVAFDLCYQDFGAGQPYHAALARLHGRTGRVLQHLHRDFFEVVIVVAGSGIHRTPTADTPLGGGDVLLIRPGDIHEYAHPQNLTFFNLAFPASWWSAIAGAAGVGDDLGARPQLPARLVGGSALVQEAARALEAYERGGTNRDRLACWNAVVQAFAPPHAGHYDLPPWLVAATAGMGEPANLREGLPALRREANVSAAHLSRTMRAHFALSPTQWLMKMRCQRAAALLTTTTWTVGRIGAECGFGSDAYFSRCFTRTMGVSPREYRARRRQAIAPISE